MAHFYPVSPKFWDDEKVCGWNDSQRLLASYLLTCKHRNLEGLYKLPVNYAAEDLHWTPAKVRKYLDALIAEGFCEYDEGTKVLLLPNALDYYQPKTTPQLKGALADLAGLPATPLKQRFLERAKSFGADKLVDALVNGVPNE